MKKKCFLTVCGYANEKWRDILVLFNIIKQLTVYGYF